MKEPDRRLMARHRERRAVALRGFVLENYYKSGGVIRCQQLIERKCLLLDISCTKTLPDGILVLGCGTA